MKVSIKLVLIYFVMQILGALTAGPVTMLFVYVIDGELDVAEAQRLALAPTMLFGFFYMGWYLWRKGYLEDDGARYGFPSLGFMGWTVLAGASAIVLLSGLNAVLTFLPDLMEQTFDVLQSGMTGVACIALLGPVLEEMLFRGAVTEELLRRYRPAMAIVLSGLLFGLFHINPAQVVSACFMGFLLAWLYWRTRSLIPCILVHVLNNSLSVVLGLCCPQVEELTDVPGMSGGVLAVVLVAAAALLAVSLWRMGRVPVVGTGRSTLEHNQEQL